jgi:hypothetical protein
MLEGGYNLDAVAQGIDTTSRLLLGDADPEDSLGLAAEQLTADAPQIDHLIAAAREIHRI